MSKTIVQLQSPIHTGVQESQWKNRTSTQGRKGAAGCHCSACSWLLASSRWMLFWSNELSTVSGSSPSGTTIRMGLPALIDAEPATQYGRPSRLLFIRDASGRGSTPTIHGAAILGKRSTSASSSVAEHQISSRTSEGPWFDSRLAHFGPERPARDAQGCERWKGRSWRETGQDHRRYNYSPAGSSAVERPASTAKLGGASCNSRPADLARVAHEKSVRGVRPRKAWCATPTSCNQPLVAQLERSVLVRRGRIVAPRYGEHGLGHDVTASGHYERLGRASRSAWGKVVGAPVKHAGGYAGSNPARGLSFRSRKVWAPRL